MMLPQSADCIAERESDVSRLAAGTHDDGPAAVGVAALRDIHAAIDGRRSIADAGLAELNQPHSNKIAIDARRDVVVDVRGDGARVELDHLEGGVDRTADGAAAGVGER